MTSPGSIRCYGGLAVAALVEGVSHVLVALVFVGEFLVNVSLQIAVVRGRACVNFAHVGFVAAQDGRPDRTPLAWIAVACIQSALTVAIAFATNTPRGS